MTPSLLVITGPVGAGKSTTAHALAKLLRQRGSRVAVIDLDLVYCMVRQRDGYDDQNAWDSARQATIDLAQSFFASGVEIVVIDGEFFTPEKLPLTAQMKRQWRIRTFTLRVSFETALLRAQGDPARGASKEPGVLRWLHDNFAAAQPYLQEVGEIIDAETASPEALAARIAGATDDAE